MILSWIALTLASAPVQAAESERKARPLDIVQGEIIKTHKSKRARTLKKAYEALEEKNYPKAIKLASEAGGDSIFLDWSFWITAQAQYGTALKNFEKKSYNEAIKNAESAVATVWKIEARTPYSPMYKNVPREVGVAELLMADAYVLSKKWKIARPVFERAFQHLTLGSSLNVVRPDSLLHYAQTCAKKESDFCLSWIWRFSSIYPKGSPEMAAVIKAFPDAGDKPRGVFHGRSTQAYKAQDLDQAAFEINMALYMDGKFSAAIKGFSQFVDEFPKSPFRFRVRYWLAQALTQEQDHDKAKKVYEELQKDSPLTYYGMLAAFTSGRNMDAPITPTVPMALERDPILQPHEVLRLERAEQFLAEDANELAALELKELKARNDLSSPFLMYLAALNAEAGTHSTAFSILGDLIQRGYDGATSATFLGLVFPLAHYEVIKKHALALNLDPILVLSLIKQESAFDPTAGSHVGATGLMQLMPATATDTDPKVERADLVEPDTNVRVGTKYLRQLLSRFNGNIVLALAGYNAGPNAADRWFRENGQKRSMLEFIETIPYKETREYVGSIIRNYYWYSRKLTPNEPAKPLAFFWGQGSPSLIGPPAPKAEPAVGPTPEPSDGSSNL